MAREIIGRITSVENGPGNRKTLNIYSDAHGDSTVVLTRPNASFNYGCQNKEYRDTPHVFQIAATRNGRHLEFTGYEPRPATAAEIAATKEEVISRLVEVMERNGITAYDLMNRLAGGDL